MAKSSVRAIECSVDRLGYESLEPEQETVVREFLGGKNVFPLKSLCTLVFHTLLTVSSF